MVDGAANVLPANPFSISAANTNVIHTVGNDASFTAQV